MISERPEKRLLLVEDDDVLRNSMVELIGGGDIKIVLAGTGKEALDELRKEQFDCAIVDLMLPDMEWTNSSPNQKRVGFSRTSCDRTYGQGPVQKAKQITSKNSPKRSSLRTPIHWSDWSTKLHCFCIVTLLT